MEILLFYFCKYSTNAIFGNAIWEKAPELVSTVNISVFNIANTIGGLIGAYVLDSVAYVVSYLTISSIILPILGLLVFLFFMKTLRNKLLALNA